MLAHQPAADDAGRDEPHDRGLSNRHPRQRAVLLQQGDGHAVADLRGVLRNSAGWANRRCGGIWPKSASSPPASTGTETRRSRSSWPATGISKADFAPYDFDALDGETLRAVYETLLRKFGEAVPAKFRQDSVGNLEWRNAMYAALIGEDEKAASEESLLGLSSEFFMQIEWLPGGRIEEGELIFDSVFDLAEETNDPELRRLCDDKCRGFIFNFVREYGDLEYVNIGRVVGSLSQRPQSLGRRDVYIAQVKQRGIPEEIVKIIRMQKWGIREHLNDGKKLLDAIIQSEEYTEYILDRRLGCRQLGMNLPARTTAKRISERYFGPRRDLCNAMIWSPYFERDYIRGMATDKIPPQKLADAAFASRLARLLGQAAAPNMIVGRCDRRAAWFSTTETKSLWKTRPGCRSRSSWPTRWGRSPTTAPNWSILPRSMPTPVNRRLPLLADPEEFASLYIDAFVGRFSRIQLEYRKRKRAFDTLFKHRPRDEAGSFAYRWECVLDRLRRASPQDLGNLIRSHIAGQRIESYHCQSSRCDESRPEPL